MESDLDAERVKRLLWTLRLGRSLVVLPTATSTNQEARQAAERGCPIGHAIVADEQTAGRGSHGRTWISPRGDDLYVSIVVEPPVALESIPLVTLAAGLAVADTVDHFLGRAGTRIKWPNDVRVRGRKCAGVLVEASTGAAGRPSVCVVGVGLNVNRPAFAPGLAEIATSLFLEDGKRLDRSEVLADLLGRVEQRIDDLATRGAEETIATLNDRLDLVGALVRVDATRGRIKGVAPTGALRLATDDGVVELYAGAVELA